MIAIIGGIVLALWLAPVAKALWKHFTVGDPNDGQVPLRSRKERR